MRKEDILNYNQILNFEKNTKKMTILILRSYLLSNYDSVIAISPTPGRIITDRDLLIRLDTPPAFEYKIFPFEVRAAATIALVRIPMVLFIKRGPGVRRRNYECAVNLKSLYIRYKYKRGDYCMIHL